MQMAAGLAPCSAEGNVRKHPRVLEEWVGSRHAMRREERSELQWELIESGWKALRPGGVLVYSTCTLNISENEKLCQRLTRSLAGAVALDVGQQLGLPAEMRQQMGPGYVKIWPHWFDTEGFFVSCFRKLPSPSSRCQASSTASLVHAAPASGEYTLQRLEAQGRACLLQRLEVEKEASRFLASRFPGLAEDLGGGASPLDDRAVPRSGLLQEKDGGVWMLPKLPVLAQDLARYLLTPGVLLAVEYGGQLRLADEFLLLMAGHSGRPQGEVEALYLLD
eukprot:TRINITY_DN22540_c0_g2_i8.p2 TRINITY_DN22540_c0_g2~~TRINITY_DN22540_c0_g2_i8.p2  ORF type:complete len:278 (+),score=60.11 TRINITY_DN22540_c0_g2_i8:670-1503(+)